MKKILSVILFSLIASALTGCNDIQPVVRSSEPSSNIESSVTESSEVKEESSKTEQSSKENVSETESSKEEVSKTESSADANSEAEQSSKEAVSETESSADGEQSSEPEESYDESSDKESSDEETSKEDDSLFSFKLSVNYVEYKVPFDYSELNAAGYYLDKSGTVEPDTHTRSLDLKDEYGHKISVQLWNPTDETKDYDECKVGSIEIKLGEEMNVILPGDFSFDFDITPETVKEHYGEPESEHIYDNYVTLRYKKDLSSTVEFFIYTDETMQKFSSVTVKNFV